VREDVKGILGNEVKARCKNSQGKKRAFCRSVGRLKNRGHEGGRYLKPKTEAGTALGAQQNCQGRIENRQRG